MCVCKCVCLWGGVLVCVLAQASACISVCGRADRDQSIHDNVLKVLGTLGT